MLLLGYHGNRGVNMFLSLQRKQKQETDFYRPDPDRKQFEHTQSNISNMKNRNSELFDFY